MQQQIISKKVLTKFISTVAKIEFELVLYDAEFIACSKDFTSFFAYPPNGSLKIGTYKEDRFKQGKYYYIDITEA